jgi:hypothetical protein
MNVYGRLADSLRTKRGPLRTHDHEHRYRGRADTLSRYQPLGRGHPGPRSNAVSSRPSASARGWRTRRSERFQAAATSSCVTVTADGGSGSQQKSHQGETEPGEHRNAQETTKGVHPTQRLVPRPQRESRRCEDDQDCLDPALGLPKPHHRRRQEPHRERPVGELGKGDPAGRPTAEHPVDKPRAVPCQVRSSQRCIPAGRCPPRRSLRPGWCPGWITARCASGRDRGASLATGCQAAARASAPVSPEMRSFHNSTNRRRASPCSSRIRSVVSISTRSSLSATPTSLRVAE